jgi:hypothetical protein
MPADHALSKLKRIPPERFRELPLVGLDPDSFPEYVPFMKKILKPFKISSLCVTGTGWSFDDVRKHRGFQCGGHLGGDRRKFLAALACLPAILPAV